MRKRQEFDKGVNLDVARRKNEKAIDLIESIGGIVEMTSRKPGPDVSYEVPCVTVKMRERSRTWIRPTFRQALDEAMEWVGGFEDLESFV